MQSPHELMFVIIYWGEWHQPLKITSIMLESQILLLCDQLTYSNSLKVYIKFHLRNYHGHRFPNQMSLRSSKGTHYLKSMWYYDVYLENIICHLHSLINSDEFYREYIHYKKNGKQLRFLSVKKGNRWRFSKASSSPLSLYVLGNNDTFRKRHLW